MDPSRLLLAAGLAVWATVGVVVLQSPTALEVGLWAGWAVGFLGVSGPTGGGPRAGFLVEVACALGLLAGGPGVSAALLCVSAGQLPFLVGAPAASAAVVAQAALIALALGPLDGLLYGGFMLFAVGTATLVARERAAREVVLRMNAELLRARADLAEAERRSERLRIARDLHDAVGHHLTALGLQLEVAARATDGPAAEPIRAARDQAKALLGEVRATVNALRDGPVDLPAGLRALAALPRPIVHVQGDTGVGGPTAEALLRCAQEIVTNAARHGRAAEVWIALERRDDGVVLEARDDGPGGAVREGNGLRGMRERVEALGGRLAVAGGPGFPIRVWVPA